MLGLGPYCGRMAGTTTMELDMALAIFSVCMKVTVILPIHKINHYEENFKNYHRLDTPERQHRSGDYDSTLFTLYTPSIRE